MSFTSGGRAVVPRGAGGCEGCEMEFVVEVDGLVISGRGRVFCIRFCGVWVGWDVLRAFLHVRIRADACAGRKHEAKWIHSRQPTTIAAK